MRLECYVNLNNAASNILTKVFQRCKDKELEGMDSDIVAAWVNSCLSVCCHCFEGSATFSTLRAFHPSYSHGDHFLHSLYLQMLVRSLIIYFQTCLKHCTCEYIPNHVSYKALYNTFPYFKHNLKTSALNPCKICFVLPSTVRMSIPNFQGSLGLTFALRISTSKYLIYESCCCYVFVGLR